ncbi:12063_t:CDS:2 [Acaulospora colombiana]|uniref:12063_t:CDS:1 n=1 Tax=Acaulospora colombiana TaxID=27376 RepID=A0ACA9K9W4_9GLOM|nr:12063_t:CDS:2 [Acaulospora colombiana]
MSSAKYLQELSSDLLGLLEKSEDYNVVIRAGGMSNYKEFKAHSILLRARSGYFRSALISESTRKYEDPIVFKKPNIPSEIFEVILRYMYSGIVELEKLDGADLLRLMLASEELQLPSLIIYAQDHLIRHQQEWIKQTLVPILHIVCHHGAFEKLRDYTLKFVCSHPQDIFESKDFASLEESILLYLLKRDDLLWDEIKIWEHVIRWGIANTMQIKLHEDVKRWSNQDFEALEFTLRRCIPLIRFVNITSGDFFHKVRNPYRKLLPVELEEQILQYHLDPDSRMHNVLLPRNITSEPIESTIIDSRHATLISNWIDRMDGKLDFQRKNPYKFKLLIRGSRDGFSAEAFHSRCDYTVRTLVVVKVRGINEVLGGYNPIQWNCSEDMARGGHGNEIKGRSFNKFGCTQDSFIFSFNDSRNPTTARLSRIDEHLTDEAIYFSNSFGPCFGQSDLHMVDSCWNCKKVSYKNEILQEHSNFVAEEYEVFQILGNDNSKERKTRAMVEERSLFIHSFDGYIS